MHYEGGSADKLFAAKSSYAKMLISMEAKKSGLMPYGSSFNKNAVEERIEAIMRMKKATLFSLGVSVLIITGIAAAFATSAVENSTNSYNLNTNTSFVEDIDNNGKYSEYIANLMASEIKDISGITDCKVDVSLSDSEFVSADVSVVTEKGETNALKADILDYVSKSLGISAENITLSFN